MLTNHTQTCQGALSVPLQPAWLFSGQTEEEADFISNTSGSFMGTKTPPTREGVANETWLSYGV